MKPSGTNLPELGEVVRPIPETYGGLRACVLKPAGSRASFLGKTMQQIQLPPLAEGEIYIGAIGDKNGDFYHVVLLPGDNDDGTFDAQLEWAKSIGGDLPTRVEQAILWAGFRDQFKKDWYWSNETHHSDSGYAWYLYFYYGDQDTSDKGYGYCRARAVRRLPI
jgi:hypothetical protein